MEDCFFPNPMGQITYFISLFLTFAFFFFRIREKFFLKIWALIPTCLTNTHNKNQCALWMSRHRKPRKNLSLHPPLFDNTYSRVDTAYRQTLRQCNIAHKIMPNSTYSNLNGRMLDHQQVWAVYNFWIGLLPVQTNICLNYVDSGWLRHYTVTYFRMRCCIEG